jgi:hypothetical protein
MRRAPSRTSWRSTRRPGSELSRGGHRGRRPVESNHEHSCVPPAQPRTTAVLAARSPGHQARVQPHRGQPPRHVVRATAGFHRHHAARWQLGAPGKEALHRQRPGPHQPLAAIDCMHLPEPLAQIHHYPRHRRTCNLRHGLPLSSIRLTSRSSILVPRHRHRTGEVPSYSFKRTRARTVTQQATLHMLPNRSTDLEATA